MLLASYSPLGKPILHGVKGDRNGATVRRSKLGTHDLETLFAILASSLHDAPAQLSLSLTTWNAYTYTGDNRSFNMKYVASRRTKIEMGNENQTVKRRRAGTLLRQAQIFPLGVKVAEATPNLACNEISSSADPAS